MTAAGFKQEVIEEGTKIMPRRKIRRQEGRKQQQLKENWRQDRRFRTCRRGKRRKDDEASSVSPYAEFNNNIAEEDSIFSGLDTPGAGNAADESLTFVHTRDNYVDDNVSHAMTAEQGYEFGYTPNPSYDDANNNQLPRTLHSAMPPFEDDYKIDDQDVFPQYTPKVGVEWPTYERPEGTRQSRENNSDNNGNIIRSIANSNNNRQRQQ